MANGEEGEPASVKDRWLLRTRPHLVIDGALRAASAVAADTVYVYVSDPAAARSVRAALAELGGRPARVEVWEVDPGYVAGEETAAVNAINGRPAKPSDKPPEAVRGGRPRPADPGLERGNPGQPAGHRDRRGPRAPARS